MAPPPSAAPGFAPIGAAAIAAQGGLAILAQFVAGTASQQPIHEFAGITYRSALPGEVVLSATPRPEHCNLAGAVHGGWIATVIDSALGGAVLSLLAPGEIFTTIEFKVNMLRAVAPDLNPLICTGKIVRRGRSTAISTAELCDDQGRLIAMAMGTCMIMPASQA